MIWTPHTPIFGLKTILAQNWTTKLKKSGQNRPFGALAAEMEAQYIPVSTYNIPDSRQLMDGGHLAYWDPIWVVWNVWRTPVALHYLAGASRQHQRDLGSSTLQLRKAGQRQRISDQYSRSITSFVKELLLNL